MRMRTALLLAFTFIVIAPIHAQKPLDPGSAAGRLMDARCTQALLPAEAALYETLAPLTIQQQRMFLLKVTPEVKSRLWIHNECVFLERHPDLTSRQHAAIREYLLYVANSRVFQENLETLEQRVKQLTLKELHETVDAAAFSDEDIVTAFYHLGPGAPLRADLIGTTGENGDVSGESGMPPCICRSNVDCWAYYSLFCHSDPGQLCMPTMMCGYGGTEACDGIC